MDISQNTGFLALGSNLGDKERFLKKTLELIEELKDTTVQRLSSIYKTNPVGGSTHSYLNLVAEFHSKEDPQRLMDSFLSIEYRLGRRRSGKQNEDRVIDIDLLLYGNRILNTPKLILPHPRMHQRQFVLEPLCELAPKLSHPMFSQTMEDFLKLVEKTGVFKYGHLEHVGIFSKESPSP